MYTTKSKISELHFVALISSKLFNERKKQKILFFRFIILLIILIWISGLLSPLISITQNPLINFILKKLYSTVCHQQNFKCISNGAESMLVCARCAGIYSGVFVAALTGLFITFPELPVKYLIASVIPLLIDVTLTTSGVYVYLQPIAFLTGLIFGIGLYFFTINELENFILNKN